MTGAALILGGARSGKTARAMALAETPRTYVATAPAPGGDAEMAARIAAHKAERGLDWGLIEAPLDLASALKDAGPETLVVDCLTLWLSNLMAEDRDIEAETAFLLAALDKRAGATIFVSNEIGLGLVPMEALSRRFRDAQGRLNQAVAAAVDRVEFVAAGLPLRLK